MKIPSLAILLTILVPFALAATGAAQEKEQQDEKKIIDIYDTLAGNPRYKTFTKLIDLADVRATFKGAGENQKGFTLFVPSDEAFAKLPQATLDKLTTDPKAAKAVVLNHIFAGQTKDTDITDGLQLKNLGGETLKFSVADGVTKLDTAKVTTPSATSTNGLVYEVDAVILPKSLREKGTDGGGG